MLVLFVAVLGMDTGTEKRAKKEKKEEKSEARQGEARRVCCGPMDGRQEPVSSEVGR